MKVTITFEADVAELDMSAMQPFVDAIADGEAAASESVYESESESELIIFADEAEEAEEEAEEEYEEEEAEDEEAEDEEAEETDEQTDQ
jgi:exosome complex component RRP41